MPSFIICTVNSQQSKSSIRAVKQLQWNSCSGAPAVPARGEGSLHLTPPYTTSPSLLTQRPPSMKTKPAGKKITQWQSEHMNCVLNSSWVSSSQSCRQPATLLQLFPLRYLKHFGVSWEKSTTNRLLGLWCSLLNYALDFTLIGIQNWGTLLHE